MRFELAEQYGDERWISAALRPGALQSHLPRLHFVTLANATEA